MKLQPSNNLLFVAIYLLAVVYSASSQCCDFSTTSCSYTGGWDSSPDSAPATAGYYLGFWLTAPSIDFKFVQDRSATETSDATYHISSQGVVISFDYYFYAEDVTGLNKLEVFFENEAIGISSVVDPPKYKSLYAFDRIGLCVGSETPKEVEAEIPKEVEEEVLPGIGICCNFDISNCADPTSSYGWYWSQSNLPPTSSVPSPTGDYYWTQFDAQAAIFPPISITASVNDFSFNYYIQYHDAQLQVIFDSSSGPRVLGILTYYTGSWQTFTISASDYVLCNSDPTCTGRLVIQSNIPPGVGGVVAIDTVIINGGSATSKEVEAETPKEVKEVEAPGAGQCCNFDASNCLESTSSPYWYWTVTAAIPTQEQNEFLFTYYIENPLDYLEVYFDSPYGPVLLDTLVDHYGTWQTDPVSCSNIVCCNGFATTCFGNLRVISNIGGGVIGGHYAIDSVTFNGGCF
ncbi:hypothetical protein CHUAL_012063 [Chamberlinius hualienensis]